MRKLILSGALLMSLPALAQQPDPASAVAPAAEAEPRLGSRDPNVTEALALLVEIRKVNGGNTVVKLGECGSIKGPFVVYDAGGGIVFSLAEGETIGPEETCK